MYLALHMTNCLHVTLYAAKAKQREREQAAFGSSSLNANKKRPLEVVSATSTSPTALKPDGKLKRDSRLGKYFEYDLSKMVNSKGGFLLDDDKDADAELRAKEKERERERAMKEMDPREYFHTLRLHVADHEAVQLYSLTLHRILNVRNAVP